MRCRVMNRPVCFVLGLVTGVVVGWLFHGCTKTEPLARVDGIVRSHVDTYPSGTGVSADLVRNNQMNSGFDYDDADKTSWKSNIQWELIDHHDKNDLYRFKWTFSPSGGTTVSNIKTVEYDGKKSVIVFQNEYEVISIEPGSVPLPKNAQQGIRP
jgi:hypothetical protein